MGWMLKVGSVAGAMVLMCACGGQGAAGGNEGGSNGGSATSSQSPTTPSEPTQTAGSTMPCDPGRLRDKEGCPDPDPETGWVTAKDGALTLQPFRTLGNDREGRAYARKHDLDFPFPNDYLDVRDGPAHPLALASGTVCTGIVVVGYREPLKDRVVPCDEFVKAAEQQRVTSAVWSSGADVVQLSELYRP